MQSKIVSAALIPSSRYANEEFSFHPSVLPTDLHFTDFQLLSADRNIVTRNANYLSSFEHHALFSIPFYVAFIHFPLQVKLDSLAQNIIHWVGKAACKDAIRTRLWC